MDVRGPDTSAFVSGALGIVLQVSRVIGIAPLRFEKQRGGWRISLSPCLYLYGCVLVTGINLITFATLVIDFKSEASASVRMPSSTRRIVWLLDVAIMSTLAFHGAYAAPAHLRSMIDSLNYLQKINKELNVPHWPRNREIKKCVFLFMWSLLTMAVTLVDCFLVLRTMKEHHNNTLICMMYFFYYPSYWIMQLLVYQFVLITYHIRLSFVELNGKLEALLQGLSDTKKVLSKSTTIRGVTAVNKKRKKSVNTIIDSLAFIGKVKTTNLFSRPVHEIVRRLALTFVSLCEVVKEIDKSHGPMLLLLLGSFLLHMTITPYYLITNVFDSRYRDAVYIILECFWCLFHGGNLMMVIEPCHLTLDEIMATRARISQLMRHVKSSNEPLAIELDLFYRHLVLNKVSYSPLQITTLTRGLVATVLGSIITYLVIIIQL